MSSFSDKGLLGELEQLVMLAALRIPADAYAVSIRDEIETRAGIALSRSSVYVTLDRLERKGYVRSWLGDPTPERGGKAKRCLKSRRPVGGRWWMPSVRSRGCGPRPPPDPQAQNRSR